MELLQNDLPRRGLPGVLWGFSDASCPELLTRRLDEGRGHGGARTTE